MYSLTGRMICISYRTAPTSHGQAREKEYLRDLNAGIDKRSDLSGQRRILTMRPHECHYPADIQRLSLRRCPFRVRKASPSGSPLRGTPRPIEIGPPDHDNLGRASRRPFVANLGIAGLPSDHADNTPAPAANGRHPVVTPCTRGRQRVLGGEVACHADDNAGHHGLSRTSRHLLDSQ